MHREKNEMYNKKYWREYFNGSVGTVKIDDQDKMKELEALCWWNKQNWYKKLWSRIAFVNFGYPLMHIENYFKVFHQQWIIFQLPRFQLKT